MQKILISRLQGSITGFIQNILNGTNTGISIVQGNTGNINFAVKVDNSTIKINGSNQLYSTGGNTTTVDSITDLTVAGVTVGGYNSGDDIPAGTSVDTILRHMLIKSIPPIYTNPTLTLSGGGNYEAGTNVAPTLTPVWTQHDAGTQTGYTLKENGTTIYTNATANAYTQSSYQLGDLTNSYVGNVAYATGPIKNDNLGNPYPTGQIMAGNINSNTVNVVGQRKLFYAADTGSTTPTTSADVRILANSYLNPVNGYSLTLNIASGTTRIVIAYPATLEDVSSIKYVELGNAEVKDTFVKTLVNVEGANSFTAISYKVFTYLPSVPFGANATYNVTI